MNAPSDFSLGFSHKPKCSGSVPGDPRRKFTSLKWSKRGRKDMSTSTFTSPHKALGIAALLPPEQELAPSWGTFPAYAVRSFTQSSNLFLTRVQHVANIAAICQAVRLCCHYEVNRCSHASSAANTLCKNSTSSLMLVAAPCSRGRLIIYRVMSLSSAVAINWPP